MLSPKMNRYSMLPAMWAMPACMNIDVMMVSHMGTGVCWRPGHQDALSGIRVQEDVIPCDDVPAREDLHGHGGVGVDEPLVGAEPLEKDEDNHVQPRSTPRSSRESCACPVLSSPIGNHGSSRVRRSDTLCLPPNIALQYPFPHDVACGKRSRCATPLPST